MDHRRKCFFFCLNFFPLFPFLSLLLSFVRSLAVCENIQYNIAHVAVPYNFIMINFLRPAKRNALIFVFQCIWFNLFALFFRLICRVPTSVRWFFFSSSQSIMIYGYASQLLCWHHTFSIWNSKSEKKTTPRDRIGVVDQLCQEKRKKSTLPIWNMRWTAVHRYCVSLYYM